jgi:uncharacterized protein (DUF924 family)
MIGHARHGAGGARRSGSAPRAPRRGKARAEWFRKDAAVRRRDPRRFGDAVAIALAGGFGEWCGPRTARSRASCCSTSSRATSFAARPRAFAGDERALATARTRSRAASTASSPVRERWFVYMPFEHAESVDAQHRSLELFGALAREMSDDDALVWARKHAEVIFRFGRYPHRNAILGRASTPEEEAYSARAGLGF